MFKTIGAGWLGLFAVLLTAAVSFGQAPLTQDGRALDANPGVGSGGRNSILSSDAYGRPAANLYVTGQVTGGASFRGRVPYFAPGQLNLTLPSESLDNFRRDSFGLEDLGTGSSYAPQPFFRPSTTAYTAGDAALGRSAPLTGVVPSRAAEAQPMEFESGRLLAEEYETSRQVRPSDQPDLLLTPGLGEPQITPLEPEMTRTAGVVSPYEGRLQRVEVSGLFGVLHEGQTEQLAESLSRQRERQAIAEFEAGPQAATEEQRMEPLVGPEQPQDMLDSREPLPELRQPSVGDLLGDPRAEEDIDVYTDLLNKLVEQRGEAAEKALTAPQAREESLESLDVDPSGREYYGRPSGLLRVPTMGDTVTLNNLGGGKADRFNRYMSLGDRRLDAGKYYDAGRLYESAGLIQPENPLPELGQSLAYFGAGETFRASYHLAKAIRLFPAMTRVRVDLGRMMGEGVVAQRRSELVQRTGEQPGPADAPLVLMLVFIEASRRDMDAAGLWAARLRPMVEEDQALAAYADYFIAGGEPVDSVRPDESSDRKPRNAIEILAP